MSIRRGIPNLAQKVYLKDVVPHPQNARLFIELESIEELTERYAAWKRDRSVILPNSPIVRFREGQPLVLLGGHRRVLAAAKAGLAWLPMRVVELDDQEAYEFLLVENHHASITTVEKAYKAAEMYRLGFSREQISDLLGRISPSRHIEVGQLVHPEMFSDLPKLCDPSITVWGEAARYGTEHFMRCFKYWDAGLWDEEVCWTEFRRREGHLPLDNSERGIRMSTSADGRKLMVRGTLDLDMYTDHELSEVVSLFTRDLRYSARNAIENREEEGFGRRVVTNYNPVSLEEIE